MRDAAASLSRDCVAVKEACEVRLTAWKTTGTARRAKPPGGMDSHPNVRGQGRAQACLLVKRILDVVLAAVLLVLSGPLLLLIAALVRATSRGSALFLQQRVGFGGVLFKMYKFRTMSDGAERQESLLAAQEEDRTFLKLRNDPRVTSLGRFLRRSSLDELPQLINVLKGEMSLVGPRPLLRCDAARLGKDHLSKRLGMLPGITGLWQVSGRSNTSDEERAALDLEYARRWSLLLDAVILARTPLVVLKGDGAV